MQHSNPHTPQRDSALKLATNMKNYGYLVHYYGKESDRPFADDHTLYQLTVCFVHGSFLIL
jgi:hypothetical protein